jgi:hypothetical protein
MMQKTVCANIVFVVNHYKVSWYKLCQETSLSNSYSTLIKQKKANLSIEKVCEVSDFFKYPPFIFLLSSSLFQYIVIKKQKDKVMSLDEALDLIIKFHNLKNKG